MISQVGREGRIAGKKEQRSDHGTATAACVLNASWLIGILGENVSCQVHTLIQTPFMRSFSLNKYLVNVFRMPHFLLLYHI